MNQLTVRQIPHSIDKKLHLLAHETGQSMNKTIIHLLEKALGISNKEELKKRRDLSRFSGVWAKEEAEEFENNIRIFKQIDPEVWE